MTADELRKTMRAALEQERDAIRRLDADAVHRATQLKEAVLKSVTLASPAERRPLILALGELKGELRRNLVLLAHARDYLRDAIELCRSSNSPRLSTKL